VNAGTDAAIFTFVPSNNDVGTCVLTSSMQEPCISGNPATSNPVVVVVNSLPVPFIAGLTAVCQGSAGISYSTEQGMTDYTWTISQGGAITGGSGTNAITAAWNSAGIQSVSVNYTNTSGCRALTPSVKTVSVNQAPVPTISGPGQVCLNQIVTYSTESGKALYNWNVGSGGIIISGNVTNIVMVKWQLTGSRTITVNYTEPFTGCAAVSPSAMPVTVLALPVPVITGPKVACEGPYGFTYATEPGMTNYVWLVSSGGIITSGAGTNSINVVWSVAGAQFVGVSYSNSNGCNSASPTLYNVMVNVRPENPVISGPAVGCQGSGTNIYTTEQGMLSYQWNVSSGGTILTNPSNHSNTVTVAWNGAGSQTVTVSYVNLNGCTTGLTTRNVFVHPIVLPTINGPDHSCVGHAVLYNTENNMAAYTWNISTGGRIIAGAGTSTVTVIWDSPGNQSITLNYITPAGCSAPSPTVKNVLVNPSPMPTITGTSVLCPSGDGVIYFTETGMSNYSWTISNGGIITGGLGTNAITVIWLISGTRNLTVNYSTPEGCWAANPTAKTITVLPVPSPAISGPVIVSVGNAELYSTDAGMLDYSWSVSPGGTIISGSGTSNIMVNWHSTGPQSVSVDVINSSGCSSLAPAVLNVQVNPPSVVTVENVTIPAGQIACFDAAQTITVAGNNTYFIVQPGGSATMIAGKNIRYLAGTSVRAGGYMHGYITTTGQYCGMMAPSMVTLPTGIDPVSDIASLPEFKIYPNPSTGLLYVESVGDHEPGILKLEVFGMQGDKIMTKEFELERKHEFSLAGKPTGIYLVRIIAGEYVKTFRVIKR
jgi:hypothetical protein